MYRWEATCITLFSERGGRSDEKETHIPRPRKKEMMRREWKQQSVILTRDRNGPEQMLRRKHFSARERGGGAS